MLRAFTGDPNLPVNLPVSLPAREMASSTPRAASPCPVILEGGDEADGEAEAEQGEGAHHEQPARATAAEVRQHQGSTVVNT